MLEDKQHFPDEDDENNACVPYELRNKLHYHYRLFYICSNKTVETNMRVV